jgi:hypothetical protein
VLIVEGLGDDKGETPNTEMDLRMPTYFRGRERSLDQLADLADAVGLHVTSVAPARSRSIIEMRSHGLTGSSVIPSRTLTTTTTADPLVTRYRLAIVSRDAALLPGRHVT